MGEVAAIPEGAGSLRKVLAELRLVVAARCRRHLPGRRGAILGQRRGHRRADVHNELSHHGAGLLDLVERPFQLDVPQPRVRLVLPDGQLRARQPADLLRVHPGLPYDGPCKGGVHADLSGGRCPEARCRPEAGRRRRVDAAAGAAPAGPVRRVDGLPELPLPVSKVALVAEFAALRGLVVVAYPSLHRGRGGPVQMRWGHRVPRGDRGVAQVGHLGHGVDAAGNIVKKMAALSKRASGNAVDQQEEQAPPPVTTCDGLRQQKMSR